MCQWRKLYARLWRCIWSDTVMRLTPKSTGAATDIPQRLKAIDWLFAAKMELCRITPPPRRLTLARGRGFNIEFFNRLVGFSTHSGTSLSSEIKAADNSRPDGDENDVPENLQDCTDWNTSGRCADQPPKRER